jgi:hypothetical protein
MATKPTDEISQAQNGDKSGVSDEQTCDEPSPVPIFDAVVSGFKVCQEILWLLQNQCQLEYPQIFTLPITEISVLEYCKK